MGGIREGKTRNWGQVRLIHHPTPAPLIPKQLQHSACAGVAARYKKVYEYSKEYEYNKIWSCYVHIHTCRLYWISL